MNFRPFGVHRVVGRGANRLQVIDYKRVGGEGGIREKVASPSLDLSINRMSARKLS